MRLPSAQAPGWHLQIQHVKEAIKHAHETAVGPDGIPYRAYSCFEGSAEILFEAAQALLTADGPDPPPNFNVAFLCCLPKKPVKTDPRSGDLYDAKSTRPLSVVNTDNRIIASAMRLTLEPTISPCVSQMQRGFLQGRSMLSNIIDIDYHSLKVSLNSPHGALMLFDFEAAFPSVSHEYIFRVLQHIGLPSNWISAIRRLYVNNAHWVRVGGHSFPSFTANSGVRQGCPLSPLLFAVVVDVLLRRLEQLLPNSTVRAFADDTALVTDDFHKTAASIHRIFAEFASISCLRLNIPKTVLLPLWPSTPQCVSRVLQDEHPEWSRVEVSYAARYLGFMVGPAACSCSWTKAMDKFKMRCRQWRQLHLGIQYDTRVYKVFCFSVLSFVMQLVEPEEDTVKTEHAALRLFFPGPGNWATPQDLYNLKIWFGFPYFFPSLRTTALAAKLRVLRFEAIDHDNKSRELQFDTICGPYRHDCWSDWYSNNFTMQLERARRHAEECDITSHKVQLQLQYLHPDADAKVTNRAFQRTAYDMLLQQQSDNAENRIRHKLERWRIPTPISLLSRRAHNRLQRAFNLVAPRVAVVLFGSMWNRWCTARRFQEEGSCIFGCPGENRDSIECPVQVNFARNKLNIPTVHSASLCSFFGLDANISDDLLTMAMLNLYVCYTARNKLKHSRPPFQVNYDELMLQIAKQGTFGHNPSQRILNQFLATRNATRSD